MSKNIIKFLLALILAPLAFFIAAEAFSGASSAFFSIPLLACFGGGAAAYVSAHFWVYDFSRPYVLAHEAAHALFALFFGFKVHSMKVKKNSGYVKLGGHNEAVVLAPYIVPLYFLIGAGVCYALLKCGYNSYNLQKLYAAVLGFLWCFHVVHTIKALTETSQPDLVMAGGKIFSLVMILIFNVLVALVFLSLFFPGALSVLEVLKGAFLNTFFFWQKLLNYIWNFIIEIFKL